MNVDKIIRSRRKTISIEVKKDGTVILRAPLIASETQIKEVIAKHGKWIEKKKIHFAGNAENNLVKKYIDGEQFMFLGNYHELRIEDNQKYIFRFDGSCFIIDSASIRYSKQLFETFYSNSARKMITPRVAEFAKIIGVGFNKVRITGAETRWGSCSSKRNLNFSWKLVMAPAKVIDYVIVHEIAHLFEMNHSKRFWDIVARLFPDYLQYRAWLKTNSQLMVY